ncbi:MULTISPECIES: peptidylprolyl isomerase [unclassified Streptomyces]|uniref:FKBP-type peptidyl-prolyl cis-trans isomerase n=1 Tax=unclassified Streptomyces TaxID=2593676 RepID=UPI0024A8BDD4|nr:MULTISPECIES: peptidylprolyl isomerase [unclassified Streptomyces]
MKISANKAVSIEYTLTDDAGEELDSASALTPLVYLSGASQIVPGLEAALEGKAAGDEVSVVLEPEDAYGEHLAELVGTRSRSDFEGVDQLEKGMQLQASGPDGQMQTLTVVGVDGDAVTVDANHPLAGKRLHFAAKVVDVREASDEEIAHRRVHEGSHQH